MFFGNIRMWFPSLPAYLIFLLLDIVLPTCVCKCLDVTFLLINSFFFFLVSFLCTLQISFFVCLFPSDSFLSILLLCLSLLRRSQCQNVSSVGFPITSSASPQIPPVFSSLEAIMAQTSFSNCHVNTFTKLKKIEKYEHLWNNDYYCLTSCQLPIRDIQILSSEAVIAML